MDQTEVKRLYRSSSDKQWAGVLGGLAEYMNTDSTVVRIAYVFLTALSGFIPGLVAYFVMAVIIPTKSEEK